VRAKQPKPNTPCFPKQYKSLTKTEEKKVREEKEGRSWNEREGRREREMEATRPIHIIERTDGHCVSGSAALITRSRNRIRNRRNGVATESSCYRKVDEVAVPVGDVLPGERIGREG
jgi:hypothetical protein